MIKPGEIQQLVQRVKVRDAQIEKDLDLNKLALQKIGIVAKKYENKKIFGIKFSDLGGEISPLFYSSIEKELGLFKKLKDIVKINPTRKKPKLKDEELVPYVGLPETNEKEVQEIAKRKKIN